MASGLYGISAYQQANSTWTKTEIKGKKTDDVRRASGADRTGKTEEQAGTSGTQKAWSPVEKGSPLIPRATEYGIAIGDVQLSDQAKEYYEKLKDKYHNADFVLVSKDMKAQVQKNAASYGNASRMVVLIDEEKIERMAQDPSYRKKYEGIIAMSQEKLAAAKNSLAGSGASVKNFGMSVDENGNESFFATVEKAGEAQKQRMEKAAEKKKEQKTAEKKKEQKAAAKKREQKQAENRAEKEERMEEALLTREEKKAAEERIQKAVQERYGKEPEYLTFEADSLDRLCADVQTYSYQQRSGQVRTESEKAVGQHFDFKG